MISVSGLTKRYGSLLAIDDVSFTAQQGRVTGFLGPNGAGKSTTMATMVGLLKPTSGEVRILGRRYRDLGIAGRHVGVLLDASAQHPDRTGRETMALAARMCGVPPKRVEATLERVGLSDEEAGRAVRAYSLGMRQRLGLGQALVGDPSVLILDEPANGLDPQGIHWLRSLLRAFADEGGTVLLSSHLLREIEILADDLIMIGRGKILAQGSQTDLLTETGTFVRGRNPQALRDALDAARLSYTQREDGFSVGGSPDAIWLAAVEHGIVLIEMRPASSGSLEDLFLSLTGHSTGEAFLHE